MNYLAHAYLSFGNSGILAGNMSSDFIKGKKQYSYPGIFQKGIRLHRAIDAFTDSHKATAGLKQFFKEPYGLYAGVFTDVVYDYFLANDVNEFPAADHLQQFVSDTYTLLESQVDKLPENFLPVLRSMQHHNWLFHYRYPQGIQKSFAGIIHRAKFITDADTAYNIFQDNREAMQPYYDEFFPLLKKYAIHTLEELLGTD
jgi:acyl carrier protein phosphodiesterase